LCKKTTIAILPYQAYPLEVDFYKAQRSKRSKKVCHVAPVRRRRMIFI